MNVEIKKLTRDDWQIFKEIRLQMVREEPQAYARTYDELINLSDEEWKDKTEGEDAGIFTIWVDGELAGMNGYYFPDETNAEIWGMFIRKGYRGKGLGKKLM